MNVEDKQLVTMTLGDHELYQQAVFAPEAGRECRGCFLEGDPCCKELTGVDCVDENGQHYIWVEDKKLGEADGRSEV